VVQAASIFEVKEYDKQETDAKFRSTFYLLESFLA
jgi:hypothetical protein